MELGHRGAERLREQRDRFLAFAFAAADVLVEIGPDRMISYCAGASESVLGLSNQAIVGRPFLEFVEDFDRPTLDEAIRRLRGTGRIDHIRLRFRGLDQDTVLMGLSGIRLPSAGDRMHFVELVERRLGEGRDAGEDYSLTMVDLAEAPLSNAEPRQLTDFLASVEGYLRAWSVGGDSVARLEDTKFGMVHDQAITQDCLERRINRIASRYDPAGPVTVRATTLDASETALSPADLTKALIHTINRFIAEGGESFSIHTLRDGYKAAMEETLQRVNVFRQTINSDRLVFVFQPIVDLKSGAVHHYEVLARVNQGGRHYMPSQFISFAEDVGVVSELDMVVCRRALNVLSENRLVDAESCVAINLSGGSLSNGAFVADLMRLLSENRHLLNRLLIEITESSEIKNLGEANQVVQQFRQYGCGICLDDFGAGAAAFHYLRALEVDYLKIDGSYIIDAFVSRLGKPFLKAITGLSRDLGIKTIGEMVENEEAARLLREVRVDYGQGWYFGRPMPRAVAVNAETG
ncbi:MAG: EAL domain-containing protein [Rhodospirillales bacterium]|nr:EAL domain-containing protein [Rhodospirillales bacterium]